MVMKLSSLRVTAEMDVAQYVRATKEMGAANEAASRSVKEVGQSLAAVDAAASKTVPGVASLSRVWITGYGEAAKFEAAVRRVGNAMDRGMDTGRAAAALDNVYRKFGQTADAATLAKQGFTALAPVVSALNDRYETTAAIADRAAASTKRLSEAQRAQQQINSSLGIGRASATASGASYEALSAEYESRAASAQALRREYDQLAVAGERRVEAEAKLNRAVKDGFITDAQRGPMLDSINKRYEETARALSGSSTPLGKYTTGMGLARHELINLSRQVQDVGVSLASGQSFMTVLVQQGTQIVDIFASSRTSVSEFLAGIGPAALRILPAVAAATAAIYTLYKAFDVSNQQQTLSNSLLGSGRASGLTGGQLEVLAKESAASADITVANARLIGAEFVKLGQIANDNLPRLTKVTKDYAAATGQTLPEAAKELRQALADPERGAQALGEKLGTLDQTVVRSARTAGTYNERLAAMKGLLEEVGRAAEGSAERSLSKLERLWENGVKKPLASLGEGAAGLILGKDDAEKAAALRSELAGLQAEIEKLAGKNQAIFDPQIKALQERGRLLQEQIAASERALEPERQRVALSAEIAKNNQITARADSAAKPFETLKMSADEAMKAYKALQEQADTSFKKMVTIDPASRQAAEQFNEVTSAFMDYNEKAKEAKRYADELRKADEAGGVEAFKTAEAIRIKGKYLGDTSAAARVAMAGELALNDAFATQSTEAQRNARVNAARNQEAQEGSRALAEANTQALANVFSLKLQTDATRAFNKESAETAKIRAEAKEEAKRTGGDEKAIFDRKIGEEQERLRLALAGTNAELKERTSAQEKATAAALAGNKSSGERNALEREYAARAADLRAIEAKGITDAKEKNRLLDEGTALRQKALAAERQGAGADFYQQQGQDLESLQKQRDLIFATQGKRIEELEVMRAQQAVREMGLDTESGIGQKIVERARQIGKEKEATEEILRIRNQIRQAQDFAADSMKSFLSDLLTGTDGITGALKNLGKGFLSASLDALISGKGPLAGITGLASPTKDGQGGLLGALTSGINGIGKSVEAGSEKGAKAGTVDGVVAGFGSFGSGQGGLLGIDAKSLTGGLTAIAGLAGAYGTGAAAGSMGQAAFGGAISGGAGGLALAGSGLIAGSLGSAAVLGPLGAALGVGLAVYGQQQKKKADKAERQRVAEENYNNAKSDIASFRSQARGEPQDTLATRIRDAETTARKLADVAFLAGKSAEATAIWADGQVYATRAVNEFRDGFSGLVESLESGTGPSSPFSQAKGTIKTLGDELKAFIASTDRAYGDWAPQMQEARDAAASYAIKVLDGSRTLSVVASRMEEIRGTGAGLQQVLTDLGWSSQQAADAISKGTIAALARLKETFESDLTGKINDARGSGYLNDLTALFTEVATLRADAASLGTDQGLVTDYFSAAAQEIVNGANLTGDAFNDLIMRFPGLMGVVREAGITINETARAIEAASRRLGFQDRIFNALNDNSTLAGQLAAFDRSAQRERAEEIRLGGDAINDLEGALAAERLKIITDFANSAAEEQKRALEEAQNFFDTFSRNLRQFVDGLRSGSDSPLSPQARLAAAQGQYNAQLALAQGGDRDAINGLTTYASALLEAGEAFYASSAGYQQIFDQVTSQLLALPTQVSAEQFIVDAIENASAATISAIDTNGDGFISLQEATNANLGSIFRELDINGDGQISALELIRGATRDTANSTDYQSTLIAQTQNILASANSLQATANNLANYQAALLDQIRVLQTTSDQTLDVLTDQFTQTTGISLNGVNINNNMRDALNKVVYNTASTVIAASGTRGAPYTYAMGGWVSGPGTGTSDSIAARLSNGEFVVNARAANENRDLLEQINGGAGRFDALAVSVPQVVGLPAMSAGGGSASETRMLREELRAVRQELSDIKRAVVAGAMHVREGVDAGISVQREAVRETKFKKKAA